MFRRPVHFFPDITIFPTTGGKALFIAPIDQV